MLHGFNMYLTLDNNQQTQNNDIENNTLWYCAIVLGMLFMYGIGMAHGDQLGEDRTVARFARSVAYSAKAELTPAERRKHNINQW